MRFGQTKKMTGQVEYVHMLNGTLTAITRTICAILEVHQTRTGIAVPPVLQRFMPDSHRSFIPFLVKEPSVTPSPSDAAAVAPVPPTKTGK